MDDSTKEPLRIAVAGLGTVGVGVVKVLQKNAGVIKQRTGRDIEIVAVSARSKKDRGVDLAAYQWVDRAVDMAELDNVDVVVEMIGGADGVAKELVEKALQNGKSVVTANKALLAVHGAALTALAERNGVALAYEASVAGGIPAIKMLREGLSANTVRAVYGILNGTCNYMLTNMRETGRDYDVILNEAQALGYAEADPTTDVGGFDAAHKLTLLSALAFGVKPDFNALSVRGIEDVTARDIQFASALGYKIKLLGIARKTGDVLMQSVEPCLVPESAPIAKVEGVFNAVFIDGDFVDQTMAQGRGAGEGPTASSVVADLVDIARGNVLPVFGVPFSDLEDAKWADITDTVSRYYLHAIVEDHPGVIAQLAATLEEQSISIATFNQHARDPGQPVSVFLTTHDAKTGNVFAARDKIESLPCMRGGTNLMRIEHV